ncbi:hypothetical protein FB467_2521 [Ornithinicoccus hortensis]|uniref:Uncharacterized protein n=1 Tax=Ornithinicoccus hortensis TaxID=82346 RepID=A0A542YTG3_9MICO|nr:hypothetical protein FB467_2521 [Ornithinicoccus hortensis]
MHSRFTWDERGHSMRTARTRGDGPGPNPDYWAYCRVGYAVPTYFSASRAAVVNALLMSLM